MCRVIFIEHKNDKGRSVGELKKDGESLGSWQTQGDVLVELQILGNDHVINMAESKMLWDQVYNSDLTPVGGMVV